MPGVCGGALRCGQSCLSNSTSSSQTVWSPSVIAGDKVSKLQEKSESARESCYGKGEAGATRCCGWETAIALRFQFPSNLNYMIRAQFERANEQRERSECRRGATLRMRNILRVNFN